VLGAVTASLTVGGRKKALETLTEARAKIEAKDNPKARVTIRLGERPAALALVARGPERAAAARAGGDSGRSWCPARDEERGQSQQRQGRHARPPRPPPQRSAATRPPNMALLDVRKRQSIQEAVDRWRGHCLLDDGSLLFDDRHAGRRAAARVRARRLARHDEPRRRSV
jgi:hypothetical protein